MLIRNKDGKFIFFCRMKKEFSTEAFLEYCDKSDGCIDCKMYRLGFREGNPKGCEEIKSGVFLHLMNEELI